MNDRLSPSHPDGCVEKPLSGSFFLVPHSKLWESFNYIRLSHSKLCATNTNVLKPNFASLDLFNTPFMVGSVAADTCPTRQRKTPGCDAGGFPFQTGVVRS